MMRKTERLAIIALATGVNIALRRPRMLLLLLLLMMMMMMMMMKVRIARSGRIRRRIRRRKIGIIGAAGRRSAIVVLEQNDAALQRVTGVLVRPVAEQSTQVESGGRRNAAAVDALWRFSDLRVRVQLVGQLHCAAGPVHAARDAVQLGVDGADGVGAGVRVAAVGVRVAVDHGVSVAVLHHLAPQTGCPADGWRHWRVEPRTGERRQRRCVQLLRVRLGRRRQRRLVRQFGALDAFFALADHVAVRQCRTGT